MMALMMETMNRLGVLGRVVGDVRELGPRKSLLSLMFKWVVSAVVCQYLWVCPMLGLLFCRAGDTVAVVSGRGRKNGRILKCNSTH